MNRLSAGAPFAKLTASVLALAMLLSNSQQVLASDSQAAIDSLLGRAAPSVVPQSGSEDPAAGSSISSLGAQEAKSGLTFTPSPGDAPATFLVPNATQSQGSSAAPSSVPTNKSSASAAAESVSSGAGESTETADAQESPKAIAEKESSDEAVAPAAAEVTEPQSLEEGGEGKKELAQVGEISNPRAPVDPVYRKLPGVGPTVKIRQPFNRFGSNQLIHNLSFRDTPVKEVVAEIARRGNLNVIIDKSTFGKITGDLHDVTLNEAMDTVLTAAGLQFRQLDNSTIVIGTPNALASLGLNRPVMRVFRISYSNAFDVAQMLWATVFNRGYTIDFTSAVRSRQAGSQREAPSTKTTDERASNSSAPAAGGGVQQSRSSTTTSSNLDTTDDFEMGEEQSANLRPDTNRNLRGLIREQTNEGTGFNSAATDPGSQSIRAIVNVTSDYAIDQNGGRAICIPDTRNHQVFVCGTPEDVALAEEAIRLIDRRPRQVHIQSSLIEIQNQGVRQLGAALNLQGAGASGTVLGGSGSPMINFLPGLGSTGPLQATQTFLDAAGNTNTSVTNVAGIPPRPLSFSTVNAGGVTTSSYALTPSGSGGANLTAVPLPGFAGILGAPLPAAPPNIAGVIASQSAQTAFNFLTLGKRAGGLANIATVPTGLNLTLNLALHTSKAKILANPSVIVEEDTEALITLANEVVHKVTTTVSLGVVSTNVELVKAGIFLNVIPKITEDGFIRMRLRPQVSSPLGGPQSFANGQVVVTLLNVREVIAEEVRVKDGQTLVIGGLFTEQEASTLSKVPYLAEAPILGALFRNTIKGRNRIELMLLITPKIVEEQPPTALSEGGGATTL